MTDTTAPPTAAAPVLLARGRHALTEMPDGSMVITHAGPICPVCEACGCGEQQPPIVVPAMLVSLMKAHGAGQRIGVGQLRKLAAMAIRGLGGDGDGGQLEPGAGGD